MFTRLALFAGGKVGCQIGFYMCMFYPVWLAVAGKAVAVRKSLVGLQDILEQPCICPVEDLELPEGRIHLAGRDCWTSF